MANDRIGFHCTACNDYMWLTKYYPDCSIDITDYHWMQALPWVNHHLHHDPAWINKEMTLSDTPCVEFITEALDGRAIVRNERWYDWNATVHQVVQDLTSEEYLRLQATVDTLEHVARIAAYTVQHWNEFGKDYGFDELITKLSAALNTLPLGKS